jgi:hypothetical protein
MPAVLINFVVHFFLPSHFLIPTLRLRSWLGFGCLWLLIGCNSGPAVYPVSGTVKFEDGSVPTGEMASVQFIPVQRTEISQTCSGSIQLDGSYKISTFNPEDGALPGEYKVTFIIHKTYVGRESLVAPEFTDFNTTPLTATVKSGRNKFDFTIKKIAP